MDVLFAILLRISMLLVLMPPQAMAFPPKYTESAHGSSSYGVYGVVGLSRGNCGHCHRQHGADSVYPYLLFDDPVSGKYFCMACHTAGKVINKSYSFRAGGYTGDSVDNIEAMFGMLSKHRLSDLLSFINGKWGFSSSFSSPCVACHEPHYSQRDPKTSTSRGWLLRLPSKHGSRLFSDRLWGDEIGERMKDYAVNNGGIYQAPYRYGSTSYFEPDGSTTSDGSNLVDMDTFCLECHSSDMNSFGLYNTPINWTSDVHGMGRASGEASFKAPYTSSNIGSYILSCTDCHEPHGSPNIFLIRTEVNGGALGTNITSDSGKTIGYLCRRCHKDDAAAGYGSDKVNHWRYVHHCNSDRPYSASCGLCHSSWPPRWAICDPDYSAPLKKGCLDCHHHGGTEGGL